MITIHLYISGVGGKISIENWKKLKAEEIQGKEEIVQADVEECA